MLYRHPDLTLLHAPSVYDFRERPILFGPISDLVPSTPIFEMYPVGFSSIAEHLERNGFRVRIVNLALRMLKDPRFDAEAMIARLKSKVFGIDLHWLPHAHGSLEVAALCKKHHPGTPVIFGGYSASYYHEELIRYPQVDLVLRGDSTEEPLRQLLGALSQGTSLDNIPNLTWKKDGGQVVVNPLTHTVADLNEYSNNYPNLFRVAVKYFDVKSLVPIHDWFKYPITAVMTTRGCSHDCVFCGGSRFALQNFYSRRACAYRDPAKVAQDILTIRRYTRAPIFVVGDLRQPGEGYAEAILSLLRPHRPKNPVVLELFTPAPDSFFENVAAAFPHFNFEISPESHDEKVRQATGKFYRNDEMERAIRVALKQGCGKFDVFFMIGLPGQTPASVMATIDYCAHLMKTYGRQVNPLISPLAPFLDPGSLAFEKADLLGYRRFCHSLEDHRQALLAPSWKYTLSYETQWMSREEIVATTYQAALRLNRLKGDRGWIDPETAAQTEKRILRAMETMEQIDALLPLPEPERTARLMALKKTMDQVSRSTVCDSREIKWPVRTFRFNIPNLLRFLFAR